MRLEIDHLDHDRRVPGLKSGDLVLLSLPWQHDSGYKWSVDELPNGVRVVADTPEETRYFIALAIEDMQPGRILCKHTHPEAPDSSQWFWLYLQ